MTNLLNEEKPPRWLVALMAVIITIAVMMALSSCGPTHKLRKAERLIKQAIALGAVIRQDTVFVDRIIKGPETTVNVPVDRLIHHDTTIYQDRIRLHYVTYRDTLKLTVECPPDTIRVPVTIHRAIVAPPCPKENRWKWFGIGVASVLALLIILGLVRAIR